MKHGIYLVYSPINEEKPDGIEKKILAQKKMFCELGIDMQFKTLAHENGTYWNYKEEYSKADFIYFRKQTIIDWRFISFFRKIKSIGNAVVMMEIPTYPYEGEFVGGIRSKLALMTDHYFRKKIKNCIDRIIVTGYDVGENLWGVKAINIVNGVDLKSISVRNYKIHGDALYLTCVAKFSPWHGYERLIKGLANYYERPPKKEVKILMVGEGEEKSYYEDLVQKYHLEDHVKFYGKLVGPELDEIYDRTDIGICSLGRYKSGIEVIGDLKSRDFMAKGIPMLCGCQIDILQNENYPYAIYMPNNDSPVSIEELIVFAEKIYNNGSEKLSLSIRTEAERLIDLHMTYSKVLTSTKEMVWK